MPFDQAKFQIKVKTLLLKKRMTITQLSKQIGRNRSNVSEAINHGKYPRVVRSIRKELDV